MWKLAGPTGSTLATRQASSGPLIAATAADRNASRSVTVAAIAAPELTCLVAKVEPVGPKSFHMDLHLLENRFEFQRALRPDPRGDPTP